MPPSKHEKRSSKPKRQQRARERLPSKPKSLLDKLGFIFFLFLPASFLLFPLPLDIYFTNLFNIREAAVLAQDATQKAEKAALAARAVANAAKDQDTVKRKVQGDGEVMDVDVDED